jgi:DNA-binding HxlR family transcriptional regulator
MIRPTPSKYGPPPSECPVTKCLSLLSATWTSDIFWFLRAEPRRFGDLKRDLSGITAKVLSDRLRDLERRGVVERTIRATSPTTVEYSLTELGRQFLPLLQQMSVLGASLNASVSVVTAALEPLARQ